MTAEEQQAKLGVRRILIRRILIRRILIPRIQLFQPACQPPQLLLVPRGFPQPV
jgi:hypothetical protein